MSSRPRSRGGIKVGRGLASGACPLFSTHICPNHYSRLQGPNSLQIHGPIHYSCLEPGSLRTLPFDSPFQAPCRGRSTIWGTMEASLSYFSALVWNLGSPGSLLASAPGLLGSLVWARHCRVDRFHVGLLCLRQHFSFWLIYFNLPDNPFVS